MCNFVSGNKANYFYLALGNTSHRAVLLATKLHTQNYDGLENIEKRNRALEVTLGSSNDTNLGHNHTKI
jgi:hypothetical protein